MFELGFISNLNLIVNINANLALFFFRVFTFKFFVNPKIKIIRFCRDRVNGF